MKERHFIRILVSILDFCLAYWIFYKFKSSGSVFENSWALAGLALVWVASGLLTKKLFFDKFTDPMYVQSVILWIDIVTFFSIYFLTFLPFIGQPGADLRIWGLAVIIAAECLLFGLTSALIIPKLPVYHETDLSSFPLDPDIALGAKIYQSPSFNEVGQSVSSDAYGLLNEFHQALLDKPWDEFVDSFRTGADSSVLLLEDNTVDNPAFQSSEDRHIIICREWLNNTPQLNRFLERVNASLPQNGCLVVHAITSRQRRSGIMQRYPSLINTLIACIDYIWSRVIPKLSLSRRFYFFVSSGMDRNLPRPEILGRLCKAGFKIVNEEQIRGEYCIFAVKKGEPVRCEKPNYGPFIKLNRVGKDGKMIGVYKMRSMYAYSEYIQDYAYSLLGLQDGGKLNNDFRVTRYGHFIRKCWIDELPMIINLLNGTMKLVGVRPLSQHYFSLYTPQMQELRITVKPGLVPPFYAEKNKPVTLADVQDSERKYIEAYAAAPLRTDLKYLMQAFVNIVFRHNRSN